MEFILFDHNVPFTAALLIVLIIAILESIGALFGLSPAGIFDNTDADYFTGTNDGMPTTTFAKIGLWASVPGVPLLITLLIFLFFWGSLGLLLQSISIKYFEATQPLLTIVPMTSLIAYPVSRLFTHLIAKCIPKDTSSAISLNSLVGKIAEITLGSTKKGYPTRAKCKDSWGKIHHFMIEPENPQETFSYGENVKLIRYMNGRFYVIKSPDH